MVWSVAGRSSGREAVFAGFAGDVDLQQKAQGAAAGAAGQGLGQVHGIDALDDIKEVEGGLDLVGLKVADEMPDGLWGEIS